MFIIEAIINGVYFLQAHPLYWQAPIGILTTSGLFSVLKHKLALQGKARITAWLSAISGATVFLHLLIVGLPAASALGLVKITAEQSVFYIGGLTLAYNFLHDRVVSFLQSEEALVPTTSTTTVQKNQAPVDSVPAVDAGVVTI